MGDGSERRPPRPCAKLRSTWPETPAAVTRGRREVRLLGAARRKLREGVCSDYFVIGLGKYIFSPTCERNGSEREDKLVSSRGAQKCPFRLYTLIIYLNALFAAFRRTLTVTSAYYYFYDPYSIANKCKCTQTLGDRPAHTGTQHSTPVSGSRRTGFSFRYGCTEREK